MEMQRVARHVLGRGDDVLAVGPKGHEFVGGDQALAHQGAGIARLPLRIGGDDAVLGDGAGPVLSPGLEGGGADGLGEFLGTLGVGAREAQDLDQFGEMQEGLTVLLAPCGIERRDGLGKAPEVDALAGGHGVAVHDRLEVAKPRHLIDNNQQIAFERFDTSDGVGDGDPQAQPALDVLDGVLLLFGVEY